eukprot:scaffold44086_cov63-Phaeocystis_antarctica.AAC.10
MKPDLSLSKKSKATFSSAACAGSTALGGFALRRAPPPCSLRARAAWACSMERSLSIRNRRGEPALYSGPEARGPLAGSGGLGALRCAGSCARCGLGSPRLDVAGRLHLLDRRAHHDAGQQPRRRGEHDVEHGDERERQDERALAVRERDLPAARLAGGPREDDSERHRAHEQQRTHDEDQPLRPRLAPPEEPLVLAVPRLRRAGLVGRRAGQLDERSGGRLLVLVQLAALERGVARLQLLDDAVHLGLHDGARQPDDPTEQHDHPLADVLDVVRVDLQQEHRRLEHGDQEDEHGDPSASRHVQHLQQSSAWPSVDAAVRRAKGEGRRRGPGRGPPSRPWGGLVRQARLRYESGSPPPQVGGELEVGGERHLAHLDTRRRHEALAHQGVAHLFLRLRYAVRPQRPQAAPPAAVEARRPARREQRRDRRDWAFAVDADGLLTVHPHLRDVRVRVGG